MYCTFITLIRYRLRYVENLCQIRKIVTKYVIVKIRICYDSLDDDGIYYDFSRIYTTSFPNKVNEAIKLTVL